MIEHEVNITKDGFNIQTDIQTFKGYYRRLGWRLVGRAPSLDGFTRPQAQAVLVNELSSETIAGLNSRQGRLF